jgi:hypothetical protein
MVTARDERTHIQIEIEFADASRRRVVFADFNSLSMGALGDGGAVFAGTLFEFCLFCCGS